VRAAVPPERVAVPRVAEPLLNVTLPVAEAGETVAVTITLEPKIDGFADEVRSVEVDTFFTVWVNAAELLGAFLAFPPYVAVREWDPGANIAVVRLALPRLRLIVPSVADPLLKVTLPVAVEGETFAVSVTLAPNTDGFAEEAKAVVVRSRLTVCTRVVEVLPPSLASPPYTAVKMCDPIASVERPKVATPLPSVPVPILFEPSRNITVPVAVTGVTVAVKDTL
jgi:hypothetical protein